MKKLSIITLGVLVSMSALAQHDHGKMDHSKKAHANMDGKAKSYTVPAGFTNQLSDVFNVSLKLTQSFASDNAEEAKGQAENVKNALAKVDMELLKDSGAMMDWMMYLKELNTSLNEISASSDIKIQRASFVVFNQAMYKSLKAFGTGGNTIYYQHCPMANDSKGAHWLSTSKDISNPYFGGMMKSCGSTKETL